MAQRAHEHERAYLLIGLDLTGKVHQATHRLIDRPMMPASVASATDALERDIAFPWTLDELTAHTFVGPFHLSRLFGKWVGMPPMRSLVQRRSPRQDGPIRLIHWRFCPLVGSVAFLATFQCRVRSEPAGLPATAPRAIVRDGAKAERFGRWFDLTAERRTLRHTSADREPDPAGGLK